MYRVLGLGIDSMHRLFRLRVCQSPGSLNLVVFIVENEKRLVALHSLLSAAAAALLGIDTQNIFR